MAQLFPSPGWQHIGLDGKPVAGALANFYIMDTATRADVFNSKALTTKHSNPVEADANGYFPGLFFAPGDYKVEVTDAGGIPLYPTINGFTILKDLTAQVLEIPVIPKTANYVVLETDRGKVIEFDTSAGSLVVTLGAVDLGGGFPIWIGKTVAANSLELQFGAGETAGGDATIVLTEKNQVVGLSSQGAPGWAVFSATNQLSKLTAGILANNVLQLNVTAQIPAVDGSLLKNLAFSHPGSLMTENNGTTPNSKLDITTLSVIVRDNLGSFRASGSIGLTADITASGANGLDTGAEASSTWYYVYVILNPTTGIYASLLSTSATAPTMPAGYTFKNLVGAIYNDGSSNFRRTFSTGRSVFQADVEVLNGAGVTSWTSLSISTAAPDIANHARGRSSASVNQTLGIRLASDSAGTFGIAEAFVSAGATTLIDGQYAGMNFSLPILTAQTVWRKHNAITGNQIIIINGFDLPIHV